MFDIREYLVAGETAELNRAIDVEDTVGNQSVYLNQLLSTSACVDIFVRLCSNLTDTKLPEGFITIGYNINITHLAPTMLGTGVTFRVVLNEITGNRLLFNISAEDRIGPVLEGSFERVVVNRMVLLERAEERTKKAKENII